MSIFDPLYEGIANRVVAYMGRDAKPGNKKEAYYEGDQPPQIRTAPGKANDNILANFLALAVNRSVSHVLAGGVTFALPKGAEDQAAYLANVWEVNRKNLLLNDAELLASVHGTGYFKIVPDGIIDPYTGQPHPRLIALEPKYMEIEVDPQDQQRVLKYECTYTVGGTGYKEVTRRATDQDLESETVEGVAADDSWIVENYVTDKRGNWIIDTNHPPYNWPYPFPPIVHGKNLPSLDSVYGDSDIDNVISLQDKSNFITSNIQKMVRLQAHKQMWARNVKKEDLDVGPDKLVFLNGEGSEIGALDLQSDIGASLLFSRDIRQTLFDISREVDITSITDKIGALTNFGLRILYSDSLAKTNTKRALLGEMLLELNRRLLVLAGFEGEASRPGAIAWKDPLPVNVMDELAADEKALAMGIVDPQTVYAKYQERYGQTWEEIQARMQAAKQAQASNDLGTMLLRMREFNGGQTGV